MKLSHAFAISAFSLGAIVAAVPANAVPVNYFVSFSITGTYPTDGNDGAHNYQGGAGATGQFNLFFDPTVAFYDQPLAGIISNLLFTVTDPFFSPLTLNPVTNVSFDGAGFLSLSSTTSSTSSIYTNLDNTMHVSLGITGWAYGLGSSVWYSQDGFGHTLTGSGTATIEARDGAPSATPIPGALPLFATGIAGLGAMVWRRKRKAVAA